MTLLIKIYASPGTGKLNFDAFCKVAIHFLDEDDEALQKELKAAFRLYDKEGTSFSFCKMDPIERSLQIVPSKPHSSPHLLRIGCFCFFLLIGFLQEEPVLS